MTPEIEKNVPRSFRAESDLPRRSYRWGEMDVGDSVFFEDEPKASQSKPALASRDWGRNHGTKFSARKQNGGVRIWRVA